LLRYLVEETVAGRSGQLKSFVVAVDGLGRGEDFDSTADSSARVQMVRLRKTLENYYARHGPVDELCLYLQPGSYTVRLGRLPTAYPMLYRPLSEALPPDPANDTVETPKHFIPSETGLVSLERGNDDRLPPATLPSPPVYRRKPYIVVALLVIAAIVALVGWLAFRPASNTALSPILELMPIESRDRPELEQTARLVSSTFAADLPRFKLARTRVVDEVEALRPISYPENTYRLFTRLEDSRENGITLYLTLDDAQTDTSIWSREVRLPAGGEATFNALIPVLGEINGPMGIIATHDNTMLKNRNGGGYPCLLKYFEFVRTREQTIEERVAACFEKPVTEQRMQAPILAARAFFTIERRSADDDFAAATKAASVLARAAVEADPNDGFANFAVARMSYLRNDCVSARFYTDRTLELNPYSTMYMTTLAALARMCNHPAAEELLDRAFLTQSPNFSKGRLMLALAAVSQDRPDRISEIGSSDLPLSRYNRINYYLTETLIAAAQGRRADAIRHWKAYSETIPPGSRNSGDKLRPVIALPAMRRKLVAFLAAKGVIDKSEQKGVL
jgi:hypothetical protein